MTLADWLQLASLGFVSAALLVNALQLREVGKQSKAQTNTLQSQVYQGLINVSLRIDEILIERPRFRRYIYGDAASPADDIDIDELEGVIELVLELIDNVQTQQEFIPKSNREGWRKYSEHILSRPLVAAYLEQHGPWFSDALRAHRSLRLPDETDALSKPEQGNLYLSDNS